MKKFAFNFIINIVIKKYFNNLIIFSECFYKIKQKKIDFQIA